ncbi:DDE-type integrase/transposase/recombinase [Virgisporangium aurantiacum]|uniref:Uncharacterized protein n=1 Tax=Virgisporangium aurantiacum TaxID=175570 RepID=A0A8J3ZND7_9ACTN|nr:DDE-type integrase/transposase/recombinase [Virgisporangium aurantiacum]GIJ64823.1 hypothetical protein Vau01_123390 [Virgisporangium aurantiacum]
MATVIDLHSRRLVDCTIADHMRTELIIDAMNAALRPAAACMGIVLFRSQRAMYVQSLPAACAGAGIRQSMSAVGSSADNALVSHSTPPSNARHCRTAALQ